MTEYFESADPDFLVSENEMLHPVRNRIAGLADLWDCKNVLDVGCNVAMSYPRFMVRRIDYYGIDFQPKFVHRAIEIYPELKGKVVTGNILGMVREDRSIDATICKDVLEHLAPGDYQIAIREMWRVARKVVMIALFHEPSDFPHYGKHEAGFWDNTYGRKEFEDIIKSLPGLKSYGKEYVGDSKVGERTLYTVLRGTE